MRSTLVAWLAVTLQSGGVFRADLMKSIASNPIYVTNCIGSDSATPTRNTPSSWVRWMTSSATVTDAVPKASKMARANFAKPLIIVILPASGTE